MSEFMGVKFVEDPSLPAGSFALVSERREGPDTVRQVVAWNGGQITETTTRETPSTIKRI